MKRVVNNDTRYYALVGQMNYVSWQPDGGGSFFPPARVSPSLFQRRSRPQTGADEWEDRKMNGKGGYTLIELIVVVGICAILAAMSLAVYARCREPAKDVSLRERMHQCSITLLTEFPQTARIPSTNGEADTFAETKRRYPGQIEDAVQLIENRTDDSVFPTHEIAAH
jgi:prepilin-type N-terminal cleavage/methylation domain-containing protein